jgi:hypothetical protein
MNFSKFLLFLFSLIIMITLILMVGSIKDVHPAIYWTFVITSVFNLLTNTYVTYNVPFDGQQAPSTGA